MRYIKLDYKNAELFETHLDELDYVFYCIHRDAFRQMFKEQGKDFWVRYLLTFRSHNASFGFTGRVKHFGEVIPELEFILDWTFINIHNLFVDGTISDVRQLMEDVCFIIQNRNLIGKVVTNTRAKDPFYNPASRDTFRRLFGSPQDDISYMRMQIVLPIYEVFAGSLCLCLRKWMEADEIDPGDQSYWVVPSDDDPPVGFKTESYDVLCAFHLEKCFGCPHGPKLVKNWNACRDPRFHDRSNPLYDNSAMKGSDWRDKVDLTKFGAFLQYCRDLKSDDSARKGKSECGIANAKSSLSSDAPLKSLSKKQQDERKAKTKETKSSSPSKPSVRQSQTHALCQADLILDQPLAGVGKHVNPLGPRVKAFVQSVPSFVDKCDTSQPTKPNKEIVAPRSIKVEAVNDKSKDKTSKFANATPVLSKVREETIITIDSSHDKVELKTGANSKRVGSMDKESMKLDGNSTKSDSVSNGNDTRKLNVCVKDRESFKSFKTGGSDDIDDVKVRKVAIEEFKNERKVAQKTKSSKQGDACMGSRPEKDEVFRCCASCSKVESRYHEFKKCKRCKDDGWKNAKYYCGKDCQVSDWNKVHRLEHREVKQTSSAVSAVLVTSLVGSRSPSIAAID